MAKSIKSFVFIGLLLCLIGAGIFLYLTEPNSSTPYDELIDRYSERYELNPALVMAVIRAESKFDPNAHSKKDAYGLMQITEPTLQWALMREGQSLNYTAADLYDPEINIKYGCYILSLLFDEFHDQATVLAAYNAGRGNVQKWLKDSRYAQNGAIKDTPYDETDHYINKVQKYYKNYIEKSGE